LKSKPDSNSIISYLKLHRGVSSREIYDHTAADSISYITLQRLLKDLVKKDFISTTGSGKSTKYQISKGYQILYEIKTEIYFEREIDEREIKREFNYDLIKGTLNKINLFTLEELKALDKLQAQYLQKTAHLSDTEFSWELERLAIDLSWKSSQIEGNTYSLLETERLLKDKETAAGKTVDEALMLLNHKAAIDFLVEHQDYVKPLSLRAIEDIHSFLVKELGVERNIRKRTVGISGTNYRPPENEFQIKEAMEEMCALINLKENVFEKAILILLLISYIQPFVDGNKRTARIVSNAMLMLNNNCPISFRTVDSAEYKKAMLIFYEQNNISAFKKIFIEQYDYAVNTYF
jgi:Fic family protein